MRKKRQSPAKKSNPPTTRLLSGAAKSAFLRGLAGEAGADPTLIARLDAAIVQALVRHAPTERRVGGRAQQPQRTAAPDAAPDVAMELQAKVEIAPPLAPSNPAPFNPYAFSAMAVLMNEGRPALQALLDGIADPEQIGQLAQAQSVRLAPALLTSKKASMKALRSAFIEAVEKRIAHRKAVSG